MIGSENGRSADTYAVTSRDARSRPAHAPAHAAPSASIVTSRCRTADRLLRAIGKVVELGHAVGLRPDADLPCILERLVVPVERLLAVERDREMAALEVNP